MQTLQKFSVNIIKNTSWKKQGKDGGKFINNFLNIVNKFTKTLVI